MDIIDISQVTQQNVYLPAWNVELTVLLTPQGAYYILRQLCTVLGVDTQAQTSKVRDHVVLSKLLRPLPVVTTTRGRQMMLCLHRRGVAWWMASINVERTRKEVRSTLLEFQEAVVDAAERVLFGQVDNALEDVKNLTRLTLALEERVGKIEDHIEMPETDD